MKETVKLVYSSRIYLSFRYLSSNVTVVNEYGTGNNTKGNDGYLISGTTRHLTKEIHEQL
jgi:hypothetical protein